MIAIIVKIFKRIAVLIIPLFIISCAPKTIIHDLVSDTSIERNKLSSLISVIFYFEHQRGDALSKVNNYEVHDLEIDGRKDMLVNQKFGVHQFILKPGIHEIKISVNSINHYIKFDAKPGKDYALQYDGGYFSKTQGDSIRLNFSYPWPVLKKFEGWSDYSAAEKVPIIDASTDASITEFKPHFLNDGNRLCLYDGDSLSPSQTAKLLTKAKDKGISLEIISGQSNKITINYDCAFDDTEFTEFQILPGQYDLSVYYAISQETWAKNNQLIHLDAQAGHTYTINPNIEGGFWYPAIEEIATDSP